ncbi:MAG TPA: hypothetical protein ENN21_02035 [Spirochaetes bacterium]|nr:hypothetical protein [Spirochaetota bacterium]
MFKNSAPVSAFLVMVFAALPLPLAEAEESTPPPASLIERSAAYFKVGAGQVDAYRLCNGAGSQVVYRAFNKTRKGAAGVFIVTAEGALGPEDPGYGFDLAAAACGLVEKLPGEAALAARLYILFTPEARLYGMPVEDPERFRSAFNAPEINPPSSSRENGGFLLDFWTRNTNTDVFYHLKVYIGREGRATVRSKEKKRY